MAAAAANRNIRPVRRFCILVSPSQDRPPGPVMDHVFEANYTPEL
jgi:hypothetical protein